MFKSKSDIPVHAHSSKHCFTDLYLKYSSKKCGKCKGMNGQTGSNFVAKGEKDSNCYFTAYLSAEELS
jgi:hypothetical protein